MYSRQLVLHHFYFLLRIECELLHGTFVVACLFVIPFALNFLRLFHPVEQRLLHENLTGVQNQTLSLSKGPHGMDHGLLVGTFERVWSNDSLNLLSQSERHHLGKGKLSTAAKSDSKVDTEDFTVSGVDQEVLQVPVTHSDQVGSDREGGHTLDKLILDCDESSRGEAQVLKSVPQEVPAHQIARLLEAVFHLFALKVQHVAHLEHDALLCLFVLVDGEVSQPLDEAGLGTRLVQ